MIIWQCGNVFIRLFVYAFIRLCVELLICRWVDMLIWKLIPECFAAEQPYVLRKKHWKLFSRSPRSGITFLLSAPSKFLKEFYPIKISCSAKFISPVFLRSSRFSVMLLRKPWGTKKNPGGFEEKISAAIFLISKHRGEKLLKQFRWGRSHAEKLLKQFR